MNSIKLKAYAKINLGLDVVRKREDGYHEVRMIMQTIGLYDKVSILRTNNTSITVKTNLPYLPTDENNLVYKAAALIKKTYNISQGVHIILDKKIPVAAGLAGGSSNAAAVLYGLNRLFHLRLPKEELLALGLKLGADVPYCLIRGTALSEGIGEKLTPLPPFPSCYVLIVKPGINVSTRYVYENLKLNEEIDHPDIDAILLAIKENDLHGAVKHFGNVLETVTTKEYPVIGEIKEQLINAGAITSLMSGSGPTVFGLFDSKENAERAFYHFKTGKLGKQVYLTGLFQPSLKFL
ncbi:4-(cytidine 5'-diphospho)-2-C-methyl-D-erythritol kinase [Anaerocolumna xylanovorans]|uniref:4-diphosphocytidyl-2-C-methyl-D-erythritol kinase n=1 Tax=Anaerocolumna xylanovorans DSM 12503 TaxID=1121345 RepID=A0A1M7YK97_9FIRM|nr:4-(cytidine 5'-diphospho)-2-C-methyl-D-erythritol kinase [Anaerocolumna xylanovorans]SHO52958.1 4-diphosphocytidyl-2-C-methyl-D-erythritol kinase [Anaerocolumna xylanovorans DSM 12503]